MNNLFVKATAIFLALSLVAYCREDTVTAEHSSRDYSINTHNAYSNLFFDSLELEHFIITEVSSDSVARYMRTFYNARNYSFAWFEDSGLTIQAQGFWNAHNRVVRQMEDSSIYDRQLHSLVDFLLYSDTAYSMTRDTLIHAELEFTRHFFRFVHNAYAGKVDPKQVQWNIPRRKLNPPVMLANFINGQSGEWQPLNRSYRLLQRELFHYKTITQNGGWQSIKATRRTWKKGEWGSIVAQVKKRLRATGELSNRSDTSLQFTPALEAAVKKAQRSFGFTPTGIITPALIKELNVTVESRSKQMLLNLERMKWMPKEPDKYLTANIPEFRLHVIENGNDVLTMKIVVGKAVHRTVIFADELQHIVFSPYWNIPQSIVRNEILPAMKRNKNYLREKNMEITGNYNGLPVIRQKPGLGNALGHVKFIFPNRYSIYFHDTPARSLFNEDRRAFSHGCVRLEHPYYLAKHLLKDDPEWTGDKIWDAMHGNEEIWVPLGEPVAVYLTYFTSWVDENGLLHFAKDIYGHDDELAQHLFQ